MTDTHEAVIHEALTIIDKALGQMMSRALVSSGEITGDERRRCCGRRSGAHPGLRGRTTGVQAAASSLNAFTRQRWSSAGSAMAALSRLTPMSRLWL
jgi:hypothetical protein